MALPGGADVLADLCQSITDSAKKKVALFKEFLREKVSSAATGEDILTKVVGYFKDEGLMGQFPTVTEFSGMDISFFVDEIKLHKFQAGILHGLLKQHAASQSVQLLSQGNPLSSHMMASDTLTRYVH